MLSNNKYFKTTLIILGAAVAYFLAGSFALPLAIPPSNTVVFWPAAGISLALALKFGPKVLLGILIGDFLLQFNAFGLHIASFDTFTTVAFEFSIALSAVFSTYLSLSLLKRYRLYPDQLITERSILKLLLFAGPIATLIPAITSVYLFSLMGLVQQSSLVDNGFAWWLGDSLGIIVFTPLTLLFIDLPGKVNTMRRWTVSIPILFTLLLAIFLYQNAKYNEHQRISSELLHQAETISLEINQHLSNHINFIQHLRDSVITNTRINLKDFEQASDSIRQLHPDIQAIAWDVVVNADDRLSFEQQMQAIHQLPYQITKRDSAGNMVRIEDKDEYIAIAYISPYEGNEKALGFDPSSNPELQPFFYQARDTAQTIITSKISLVQGSKQQIGIITYLPVYKKNQRLETVEQRQSAFIGNLAGVYYLDDIINSILKKYTLLTTHISISDISNSEQTIPLYSPHKHQHLVTDLAINYPFEVGNRQWEIVIAPDTQYFRQQYSSNLWLILIIGCSFTAILSIALMISSGRKARIEEVVTIRTNSLNKAKEDLRLLAITFESHEAILITDAQGKILRVNHAFSDITGYSEDEVLGKDTSMFSSGRHDKSFYQAMWKQLNESGRYEGEMWNRRKNHEVYPERQTITAIKDEHNEVVNYVTVFSDITEQKDNEQQIKDLAFYDPLTTLPNRRLLINRLEQEITLSLRSGFRGTVIFLDLDDFKKINDSLGHQYGDELLKQVAQRLSESVCETDTVSRIGGDEFVILLARQDLSSDALIESATLLAEKIINVFQQPFILKTYTHHITSSMGIATFPAKNDTATELLRQADTAMYKAKKRGKNAFSFYEDDMQLQAEANLVLEHDLRIAITEESFELHYQPQVDQTGTTLGSEALLRWHHPKRGMISPADFIPLAEESGLIITIGQWVMIEACSQMQSWLEQGLELHHISVNVSPKQFRQADFITQVQSALSQSRLAANKLMLEITEGIVIDNVDDTIKKMDYLKKIGVQFSIDDFGTGYSSLSYLKRLPIDELKIDQSFVRDISTDSDDAEIVSTIIAMATHLNLVVVAEGVEDKNQLEFLNQQGCHLYQGYFFSRPLTASNFKAYLLSK